VLRSAGGVLLPRPMSCVVEADPHPAAVIPHAQLCLLSPSAGFPPAHENISVLSNYKMPLGHRASRETKGSRSG